MSAVNPRGSEVYWFEGLPFDGLKTPYYEYINGERFWFEGLPLEHLYPSTGSRRYNLFELQLDMNRM